jgi:hypothetical protein
MGAADDMKKGLTKVGHQWTKQRKAEEKSAGMRRYRAARLVQARDMFATEAAEQVMEEAYMKASGNGEDPANVRQIFYVARPLIEGMTGKPLNYNYFSQTLLPNYLAEHGLEGSWDVVYDDRGHCREPHTGREFGLGTISVRNYLGKMRPFELVPAELEVAGIETRGPSGCYGAILYIEKEGFMPLLRKRKLAERYDIAIMSAKGMSVTAARLLAEGVCGYAGIPLLVLHDFDRAGIIIKDTLEHDTRRYTYGRRPYVIDLGLRYDDIDGLPTEMAGSQNISDERLHMASLSGDAIEFLRQDRVELNAMTSPQFIEFVERELQEHNIKKVIPGEDTLKAAYQMFVDNKALRNEFEDMCAEHKVEEIDVPTDLAAQIDRVLNEHGDYAWHEAVQSLADEEGFEIARANAGREAGGGDDDLNDDDSDLSDIEE